MEVIRPSQAENTAPERMASGSSGSTQNASHGMLQVYSCKLIKNTIY